MNENNTNNIAQGFVGKELTFTRTFNASREKVWNAWTNPDELKKWFAPKPYTVPTCRTDVRPKGEFYLEMKSPAGQIHPAMGEYVEVQKPHRFVLSSYVPGTDGDPMFVVLHTLTLDEVGDKTKMVWHTRIVSATAEAIPSLSGMEEGCKGSLANLTEVLEGHSVSTKDREIVTTRVINASRERVFEAFTNPAQVVKWWGPNGFTTTNKKMEVHAGGVWEFTMHGPDGRNYPNHVVYDEIVKPSRIVYTHGPTPVFQTTITLEENGYRTTVTMRAVLSSAEELERVVKGHNAIEGARQTLSRLDAFVSKD